jgi:hypothetical protein
METGAILETGTVLDPIGTWKIDKILLYLVVAFLLCLVVRVITSSLKALEQEKLTFSNFKSSFIEYFLGYSPKKEMADYWLAFILGFVEMTCYPVLMATKNWNFIGAWLGFKTVAQWNVWKDKRAAFNRFLIGNALVLIFAALIMLKYYIVIALWSSLIVSIILTIPAVIKKNILLLIPAAFFSLIPGLLGLMTAGILILILTMIQITLIAGYALKAKARLWILLSIASFVIWLWFWTVVGNPFGWKYTGAELQMELN